MSLTVPCSVGDRNPADPENDPLYALAEELDVPVGFHAGGPRFAHQRFVDAYAQLQIEFPFDVMFAVTNLVCGGVLERFRRLRIAMLEAGAGWAPFLIHRLDEHYEKRPGEDEPVSTMRGELLRWLANRGRDEKVMAFARSEAARYLKDSTSVDPGIADAVVSLAAKAGDAAMFDDYGAPRAHRLAS